MLYRAAGDRCAVHFESLNLPLPPDRCIGILESIGFVKVDVDVVAVARSQLGNMSWKRKALPREAPAVFNCSTFIKWVWAQKGTWLPRRAIQQREFGVSVLLEEIRGGDVLFLAGHHACYYSDPNDGVGHVGLLTHEDSVVHAGGPKKGVNEISFQDFLNLGEFRGTRRYSPAGEVVHTFVIPPEREVEWSDDFRWLILEKLP